MYSSKKKSLFISLWFFIIVIAFSGLFFKRLIVYTESPQFCIKCHSMQEQYDAWKHSVHKNFKCIDCHLPNDNLANHYLWKAIDGTKDLVSQTFGFKEWWKIHISNHGRKILQLNCIRCHEGLVMHINKNRNCIDCHKNISHKRTAFICSFNSDNRR